VVDNKKHKFSLPGMKKPYTVCILSDSIFLKGDHTVHGAVRRYKVENTTLALMWKYPHI